MGATPQAAPRENMIFVVPDHNSKTVGRNRVASCFAGAGNEGYTNLAICFTRIARPDITNIPVWSFMFNHIDVSLDIASYKRHSLLGGTKFDGVTF